ncbi:MAG: sulfatase [Planctomycetota bacterium]
MFVLADDLGWGDVGFQGSDYHETPNLDRLAREGMVLGACYAAGGNCQPSRASLLSGQYTPRHSVYAVGSTKRGPVRLMRLEPVPSRVSLAPEALTLAEALRGAGYSTGHFGKWHLGNEPGSRPRDQGFDASLEVTLGRGGPSDDPKRVYALTKAACDFLEANRDRPFFAYVAHHAIHEPLEARSSSIERFRAKPRGAQHRDPLYAACLYDLDDAVGILLRKLAELGLERRTIFVFSSDNGATQKSSQEPLRGSKGSYYEGGIRVPAIVRWPGVIAPGSRSEEPAIHVDFYPTFLEAAGAAAPLGGTFDGRSLVPLFRGGSLEPRAIFWHFPGYLDVPVIRGRDPVFRTRPVSVIRKGSFKLHLFHEEWGLDGGRARIPENRAVELYDVASDPGEREDLAARDPERRDELLRDLLLWIERTAAPLPRDPNPEYAPEKGPKAEARAGKPRVPSPPTEDEKDRSMGGVAEGPLSRKLRERSALGASWDSLAPSGLRAMAVAEGSRVSSAHTLGGARREEAGGGAPGAAGEERAPSGDAGPLPAADPRVAPADLRLPSADLRLAAAALRLAAAAPCLSSPGAPVEARNPPAFGEPYELRSKRLAFTSWRYVRPGSFAWVDALGRNVTVSGSSGPKEARLVRSDPPRGIRIVAEPALREGPLALEGRPGEERGIALTTVLKDGDVYKAWGIAAGESGTKGLYFESADGRAWSRGEAAFSVDGRPGELNLGEGTVFIDPAAAPAERYKLATLGGMSFEDFEAWRKRREEPWDPRAMREDIRRVYFVEGLVSPDGLRWTRLPEPLSVEHSDTQIVGYYDEDLGDYVVYTRTWMVDRRSPRGPVGGPWWAVGRRSIGRTESGDFRRFPLSETILVPPLELLPSDVLYTNCRTALPGAPREHLLFPTVWHTIDDSTSVLLASSSDGRAWTYVPGGPIFRTAAFGAWDGGCVFARPNLIELPDGAFALPYTGYDVPHKYPRGQFRFAPGYMLWPKGRLAGIEAEGEGEFATIAFLAPGRRILANALTKRGGRLLVEVAGTQGAPLAGRSFADCDPLVGDLYREPVRWRGEDGIGVPEGAPIVLRFRLDRAKLYFLDFD